MSSTGGKLFNVAGPCLPDRHYMLPALERLPEARRPVGCRLGRKLEQTVFSRDFKELRPRAGAIALEIYLKITGNYI